MWWSCHSQIIFIKRNVPFYMNSSVCSAVPDTNQLDLRVLAAVLSSSPHFHLWVYHWSWHTRTPVGKLIHHASSHRQQALPDQLMGANERRHPPNAAWNQSEVPASCCGWWLSDCVVRQSWCHKFSARQLRRAATSPKPSLTSPPECITGRPDVSWKVLTSLSVTSQCI